MLQPVRGGHYVTLGASGHLSTATSIPFPLHNSIRALLPHQLKAWGNAEESHSDIAFLLVSTKEEAAGNRCMVSLWMGEPPSGQGSHCGGSSKQLTALVSSGPNWPYALCSSIGTPAMCHSLGRHTWASCQKEMPSKQPVGGSAN